MTQPDILSEHAIHVWRFSLIAAPEETAALNLLLSDGEHVRLDRLPSGAKRDRRVVAWGHLRSILARYVDCAPEKIQLAREGFGRPEIVSPAMTGVRFSLSHSGHLGLVGISRNAVGVDIERVNAAVNAERLAARFFTPYETEQLCALPDEERAQMFFRLWVLKEAYLKAQGSQVPAGLSRCEFELGSDDPRLRKSDFQSSASQCTLFEIPVAKGYAAALAGLQEKANISVFDL